MSRRPSQQWRAPYFHTGAPYSHNGTAAEPDAVVEFHNERFKSESDRTEEGRLGRHSCSVVAPRLGEEITLETDPKRVSSKLQRLCFLRSFRFLFDFFYRSLRTVRRTLSQSFV